MDGWREGGQEPPTLLSHQSSANDNSTNSAIHHAYTSRSRRSRFSQTLVTSELSIHMAFSLNLDSSSLDLSILDYTAPSTVFSTSFPLSNL